MIKDIEQFKELLLELNADALFVEQDGCDDAIIGVSHRFGLPPVVAYDYEKCIQAFMDSGMTLEEAEEHMEYNVLGTYLGDSMPVFIDRRYTTDEQESKYLPIPKYFLTK